METKNRIEQYREHLFECQARAVRSEADDDVTEEEIQKRIIDLQNHTIERESVNNRFRNPALHRIFNSPPRFKKF